jgi:uncharacterized protein YbjQ (UPF0145 family)
MPQDKSPNPFGGAYEPQHHPGASASTIKPFKAVDLAPPVSSGPLGPGVSPFLDNFQGQADFSPAPPAQPKPFLPPAPQPMPMPPAPAAEWSQAPQAAPQPARAADSSAVRASAILSTIDLHAPGSESAFKPRFFLTTTAAIDGFTVETYLGIVSADIVLPKDVLFRNPAPYGELHRLRSAEDQLQQIKEKALEELAERARQLQADGVLGVTVTISSLDTVACLCSASGTAVRLAG